MVKRSVYSMVEVRRKLFYVPYCKIEMLQCPSNKVLKRCSCTLDNGSHFPKPDVCTVQYVFSKRLCRHIVVLAVAM